jgi:hypothetical protein
MKCEVGRTSLLELNLLVNLLGRFLGYSRSCENMLGTRAKIRCMFRHHSHNSCSHVDETEHIAQLDGLVGDTRIHTQPPKGKRSVRQKVHGQGAQIPTPVNA